jgi:CO/xanthine dehydrogenase FAD-binding subunit
MDQMTELKHYFAPTSLDQAVECLKDGDVTILAGGTDLTPQSQAGRIKFKHTLMNIRHIPQLSGITLEGTEIRIGALATITEIMEHPLVSSTCRCWSRPATISPATRSAMPAPSAATSAMPRRPATR